MDTQKARDAYVNDLVQKFLLEQRSYFRQMEEAAEKKLRDVALYREWADEEDRSGTAAEMWNKFADKAPLEALDPLKRERERLDRRRSELMSWLETPLVWMRTTLRTYADVYHYARHCGHLAGSATWNHPKNPLPLLEGQAKARGMRPCSRGACRMHALQAKRMVTTAAS
ncbi:hypothetical protein [Streptomyces hydrogenans]